MLPVPMAKPAEQVRSSGRRAPLSESPPRLGRDPFTGLRVAVERGDTWTTDAPFRETAAAIAAMKAKGLLAVEMEAAALDAFASARGKPVICFAHVTNQMARIDGDFKKGEADGSIDALSVVVAAAEAWAEQQ